MSHGGNAGLPNALKLLTPIKKKYSELSWADLFQLASATAIETAGGPVIDMKYGRVDAEDDSAVPVDGRLPSAGPPYQEAQGDEPAKESSDQSAQGHLRRVFGRMGLTDQDIVALSGAHTLGRAFSNRSGANKVRSPVLPSSTWHHSGRALVRCALCSGTHRSLGRSRLRSLGFASHPLGRGCLGTFWFLVNCNGRLAG